MLARGGEFDLNDIRAPSVLLESKYIQWFVICQSRSRAIVRNHVERHKYSSMSLLETRTKLLPFRFLDFLCRHKSSLAILVCIPGAARQHRVMLGFVHSF